jgi:aldehyde dehydrogenase (NAD+)
LAENRRRLSLTDADLDRALPFLVNAGIQNCGQTCSASSRILVERPRVISEVVRVDERTVPGADRRRGD